MPAGHETDQPREENSALAEALLGGDARERRAALNSLVSRADAAAVGALGAALLQSHWPVCGELAQALAQIGGDASKEQLLWALRARRHHVRSAAIKALTTLGGDDVREAIQALANDPSYEVRQDAAEALGRAVPAG